MPAVDELERVVERDAIVAAVGRLSLVQRGVVACRFVLDLDVAQTARTLGLPEGTVKSHTARALERMRESLAEDEITTRDAPAEVRHAYSDQELIKGLRSGLAILQPRSDLIDCLRERAAADQPRDLSSRPPHRRRWLPTFSGVVAMASVIVALVIGVGAVVLLGGHHPSGLRTASSPLVSPAHSSSGSRGDCPQPRRPRRPTSSAGTSSRPPSPRYPRPTSGPHCSSERGRG